MAGRTSPTRRFLMAKPRPVRLRVHVEGEAAPREIAVGAKDSWSRLADTLDALSPSLVEAFDGSGNLLRANNAEQLEPSEDEAAAAGGESPAELVEDPTTPLQGDGPLETFARLLADAHRSSGDRAFSFVEVAFTRMVEIVNAQTKRMDAMERVVDGMHKVMRRAYENQVAGAEGDEAPAAAAPAGMDPLLVQMVMQFIQGQMMKGAGNGAANGAAPHAAPPNGKGT